MFIAENNVLMRGNPAPFVIFLQRFLPFLASVWVCCLLSGCFLARWKAKCKRVLVADRKLLLTSFNVRSGAAGDITCFVWNGGDRGWNEAPTGLLFKIQHGDGCSQLLSLNSRKYYFSFGCNLINCACQRFLTTPASWFTPHTSALVTQKAPRRQNRKSL